MGKLSQQPFTVFTVFTLMEVENAMTLFERSVLEAIYACFVYVAEGRNTRPIVRWLGRHSRVTDGKALPYPEREFQVQSERQANRWSVTS